MVIRASKENFILETKDMISFQMIKITGNFTVKNLLEVRNVVTQALESSTVTIIFDLQETEEMDSSSIGLMGNLFKRLKSRGGTLGILNPPSKIKTLLDETGMGTILPVFSSLEDLSDEFDS